MKLHRRTFLRAAGVSLALPWLDAFAPTRALGAETEPARRRMVCICTPLGLHEPNLLPQTPGKEYERTPYLEELNDLRGDFSVISGLSHPGINNGHDSIFSMLTSAPHPELRAGFRNTVSLDQFAAEHIGGLTRFPSLAMSQEGFSLSWTRSGALVPSDTSPSRVFARLFLDGRPDQVKAQVQRLRDGRSILDKVGGQATRVKVGLGPAARDKLEEYFTSVRDLEKRLVTAEEWSTRPKPKIDAEPPRDVANPADTIGKTRLMFDVTHLALQTDSSRLITILLGGTSTVPPIKGVTMDHHNLSHHGKDPGKLAQLKIIELETMKALHDFLAKLKQTGEQDANLLDRTMVMFTSNLGNASSHSCKNLPMILAGGGFKHGQYMAFEPESPPPLCNLYVSMLQRLGIEADAFGSSTAALTGLEMAG